MCNVRGGCARGIDVLSQLTTGCPGSPCTVGTLCRGKHSCMRDGGDHRTVTAFHRLLTGCPRDPIDHGTTTRVNLLCCRGSSCSHTVRTCGRIIARCPKDRRTHLTVHSLGSVCMSTGHISRFTTLTTRVPKRVHFRPDRRSSLACVTTRGMCVGNRTAPTGRDFAHCLRDCPKNTFDLGTRCCLYIVNGRRGSRRTMLRRTKGLLRCPSGPCSRRTLLVRKRVLFGHRRCSLTLTSCGGLRTGTAATRHHRLNTVNMLHYKTLVRSSTRIVGTTATLLTRTGLSPRLQGRTLCCHTGTCLGRGTSGGTVSSLRLLTGSAHALCKTRTGCLITLR